MTDRDPDRAEPQELVDRFFEAQAPYWHDVYRAEGLQGLIYRERMEMALAWIDELGPGSGAPALEVGSGAGLLSVELARLGLAVTSTDTSPAMTALTSEQVERQGVSDAVTVRIGDAHALPFGDAEFDLVVALGVLPWLHDSRRAVTEMARVLRPGGLLVVSADNRWRLNSLLGQNPVLEPLKTAYRRLAPSRHRGFPRSWLHAPPRVDHWLRAAGVRPVRRATVGFGPFTLAARPLLSEAAALRLHARLRARSRSGSPVIRRMGWHYLVAARKPE